MKGLHFNFYGLSLFIFVLLAVSCKKDELVDDSSERVYPVSFQFTGFTNQTSALKANVKMANNSNGSQNYSQGYLYFWSFNNDNLVPDIRFSNLLMPNISYANGDIPNSFVSSNYAYETFIGGRAVSFSGSREILIKMPIKDVLEVSGLGFDVGSSATGAKDFEIYFSIDKGVSFEVVQLNNQFGNTNVANYKHTYTYDLRDFEIVADELWVKIIPKAGERGSSSAFNESIGVLRMDNLHLIGTALTGQTQATINKLHYYLFDKDQTDVVISGVEDWDNVSGMDLSLSPGTYHVCFLTNTSDAELIIPSGLTFASFYTSNIFSNSKADIFGYVGELVVSQSQSVQIQLDRLFSQVKIEFTDANGLEQVTKIEIDQLHEPFFYAPFAATMQNPVLDQSSVEWTDDFLENRQLVFNQFIGSTSTALPVSYNVHVYNTAGLLRTINLSSTMTNNMQLVFRGNILNIIEHNTSFSVVKNENWNGTDTVDF